MPAFVRWASFYKDFLEEEIEHPAQGPAAAKVAVSERHDL
jgi:hypothetical protein